MTDRVRDAGEMEIDPHADETGRIGDGFDAEVGQRVTGFLADPTTWLDPSAGIDGLADTVVAAIATERDAVDAAVDAAAAAAALDDARTATVDAPSRRRAASPAIIGVAAGLILLFVGILTLSAISGTPDEPTVTVDLVPTGELLDVEGSVEITETASGLRIDLDAASLPRRAVGDFYEGRLLLDDGRVVPVGTFNEGVGVTLWAGVDLDAVDELTIILGSAADPDDPTPASPGRVVFKVELP